MQYPVRGGLMNEQINLDQNRKLPNTSHSDNLPIMDGSHKQVSNKINEVRSNMNTLKVCRQ